MVDPTERGQEFSELVGEVFRVHGLLLAAGDSLARPAGLTSARWQVLRVVAHGPATVAQVARTMGLTRQTVRETVSSLVSLGMLAHEDNPHDRRARLLVLTSRGRSALRAVARRQATWARALAARTSATDLRTAAEVLRDLGDLLEG